MELVGNKGSSCPAPIILGNAKFIAVGSVTLADGLDAKLNLSNSLVREKPKWSQIYIRPYKYG